MAHSGCRMRPHATPPPSRTSGQMSRMTWFGTLTRPVGHLIGTLTVAVIVVVGAVIVSIHPQWQPVLILITVIPFLLWALVMSVIHRRRVAGD